MVSSLRRPNADLSIELEDGPHRLGKAIKDEVTLTVESFESPFSLPVPEYLLATISVHETSVSWRVRATVTLSEGKELDISQRVTVCGTA